MIGKNIRYKLPEERFKAYPNNYVEKEKNAKIMDKIIENGNTKYLVLDEHYKYNYPILNIINPIDIILIR